MMVTLLLLPLILVAIVGPHLPEKLSLDIYPKDL